MRKMLALVTLGVGLVSFLPAQSNDRLDELLAQAPARLDSTAYLVLAAAGTVQEDAAPQTAFDTALAQGFIPKGSQPDGGVTVQTLSYLIMKALNVPGGLEWTFLPNPRAAYRELGYKKAVNTTAGPDRAVAGDEVVRTLTAAQNLKKVPS